MDPSALAAWTPVAIDFGTPSPTVDWGDLRGIRFTEPFFQQTVERWAGNDPQPLVRTGFDTLAALDDAPSLDPAALIFHLSRCGSTLVSRLLATMPETLVISEPAPINAILMADRSELGEEALAPLLRVAIRALGRRRFGDERRYVLKLSSWNVRRLAPLRHAFPGVPIVWVQRDPGEIIASLMADPPGWANLRRHPAQAQALLGVAPRVLAGSGDAGFYVHTLAAMLEGVRAIEDGKLLAIDYRDLPRAVWDSVAPFIGIEPSEAEIARMRAEARLDSKSAAPRPFIAKPAAIASGALRAEIAQILEPHYRDIAHRHSRAA